MHSKSILFRTVSIFISHPVLISLFVIGQFLLSLLTTSGLLPTVPYWNPTHSITICLVGSLLVSGIFVLFLFFPLYQIVKSHTDIKLCHTIPKLIGLAVLHYLSALSALIEKSDSLFQALYDGKLIAMLLILLAVVLVPVLYWFVFPAYTAKVFSKVPLQLKKMMIPYLAMFAAECVILVAERLFSWSGLIWESIQLSFGYLKMLYLVIAFYISTDPPIPQNL